MISERLHLCILKLTRALASIHSTLTPTLRGDGVKGFVLTVGIIHSF